jgi:hypothetical protein
VSELHIPDEARALAQRVHQTGPDGLSAMDFLEQAAPLILAAELRRMAKVFEGNASACEYFAVNDYGHGRSNGLTVAKESLHARADELDGGIR